MNERPAQPRSDEEILDHLVEQYTSQLRAGEQPTIEQFQQQYPHLADEIHELLSSVAMIESLKQDDLSGSGAAPSNNKRLEFARLGDYRIIEELGRGGMGVVLLGVHESLGRRVAIKVMPAHLADNEKYVERFRREAEAAATLHHTNIVGVFGVGRSEGHHYYVMEYIDGRGLNRVIRSMKRLEFEEASPLVDHEATVISNQSPTAGKPTAHDGARTQLNTPTDQEFLLQHESPGDSTIYPDLPTGGGRFRWAAKICVEIADALEYAHRHGKLHRDIKPSNLLLDKEGRIWLTDFGLVKTVAGHTVTGTGEIVGTPQYMAPESFSGRYDITSETYCLGLTLHEMLALEPAFSSEHTTDLIRRVTTQSPAPLRKIDATIPGDLATIVEKATARESSQRYASAGQMRDDLRAWLAGRPITARRTALHRRLWLWSKRNPWAALSAGLIGLVALTTTIGYLLVSSAYDELAVQHQQLIGEQSKTRIARESAETNAQRFEDQYLRAESNVQLTLEMFDEMFKKMVVRGTGNDTDFAFDGFQELVGVETSVTASDAKYLEDMLGFFERFAQANAENNQLQSEAARAFRRVANIYHLTGKSKPAVEAYQQSINLYRSVENQSGPNPELLVLMARTNNEMALAIAKAGDYSRAMGCLRQSRRQLADSPLHDDPSVRFEIARTLNLTGSLLPLADAAKDAESLAEVLPANFRNRLRPRRRMLDRRQSGQVEIRRNQKSILEAIRILNTLIAGDDADPRYLLERTKSHARLSELQFHADDPQASGQSRQQAISDLDDLVQQYPERPEYQAVLAQVLALSAEQSTEGRLADLERARQLSQALQGSMPNNLDYAQLDAEINFQIGQVFAGEGSLESSTEAWQRTVEMLRKVTRDSPQNREAHIKLAVVTVELAERMLADEDFQAARDLLRPALGTLQRQLRGQRGFQPARLVLARYYQLLGDAMSGLGDDRGARQARRQAEQLQSRGNDAPPRPDSKRGDSKRGPDSKRGNEPPRNNDARSGRGNQ